MTSTDSGLSDDDHDGPTTRAEQRARQIERETVERACSQLAASDALTPERRQAVARLAARLRQRLVDQPLAVARGRARREDEETVDPATVASLLSE